MGMPSTLTVILVSTWVYFLFCFLYSTRVNIIIHDGMVRFDTARKEMRALLRYLANIRAFLNQRQQHFFFLRNACTSWEAESMKTETKDGKAFRARKQGRVMSYHVEFSS